MDLVKLIIFLLLGWLLLGGIGVIPKDWRRESPPAASSEPASGESSSAVGSTSATSSLTALAAAAAPFRQPDNIISSINYLKSNAKTTADLGKVRVTYYLIAKSERCAVDSLETCLQDRIRAAQIDPLDFQYTYFLDRVINSGTGILTWQGQKYFLRYDKLRANNWTSGDRSQKNVYTCSGFSYRSKRAIEFINANLAKKDLFTPLKEIEHPNGLTVSGQPAVDWRSLAVNPADIPMSVPYEKRRSILAQRYTAQGGKAPAPRVFVVLEFANGQKYLTEASDGGSGVQKGWVDWRIGNSSAEIRYFQSLGSSAKATYFVFDDPSVTLEKVLEQSRK
ncbi:MAG: hypothetical protein ONB46_10785 [candidate division KSB1 bacterium]|nr:hypothetical protein [candidate division KSB1 bacterium]MDZ7366289.1 hypothetical protein [candidate division KSB1 bacterium]MDZ7404507.1 hypothetical protein [candidate division KSB1 bacterium]